MIAFKDPEHLASTLRFAIEAGAHAKLIDKFEYLTKYGEGDNMCEIYNDFAPHSFTFVMKRPDGTRWFNGGLIYSGPGQPLNGSAPALTVGIGIDSSQHGWSIHT
jgi:Domain of unknown function (DUF4120)